MMKTLTTYDFKEIHTNITQFWNDHDIYAKSKARGRGKKRFYFLDGPPYTSGKVHIGTAWNKSLKDMVLRFKRMQGFDVWDRAGYDMHGLPTEQATEKELGIKGAKQIHEFGVQNFINSCRELCIRNMHVMNQDFADLGIWMDFENAYQSITKEFMESEWWFVKTAFEKGRLYEGLRTTTWDVPGATAVAKHELEYKEIEDTAIFVKFKVTNKKNHPVGDDEYFVIWTTTPWTIPLNLAIMVNPDLDYVKIDVEGQQWWLCKDLVDTVMKMVDKKFTVLETVKGSDMEGWEYEHFFKDEMGYGELKKQYGKLHSVLLSKEYVDTSAGSGLVHCAPGCGPEDFEVGYRNGLPAFNTVSVHGQFENSGKFDGLIAKQQDDLFIKAIEEAGHLLYSHSYVHEYPHDWRSKQPVIFRTTKQWFLKIDDIKQQLIEENNGIKWVPVAAYNAFNSWLENLRDNSISKQRFWGTPLPIWRNVNNPDDVIVVGNAAELEKLSGVKVDDLHIDSVDNIVIKKDGNEYKRIPDVLDVWVDAGTVSWNCLDYPVHKKDFEELYPADFILEGKDQIRGWYNLLHVCSNIAFGKKAFKTCYMHGFINDSQGRKMSKSLKNQINPSEITEKYGADVLRFYMIGAANPGVDMSYNFDDIDLRSRNLLVLWNVHKFLLDMKANNDFKEISLENLSTEEEYILSRLHTTIKSVTDKLDNYKLNEVPSLIEDFFLELSRTYIQLVRDKVANGSDEQKLAVYSTIATCVLETVKMFSIIAPYASEQMFYNLKDAGLCSEDSVHICDWPTFDDNKINGTLEKNFGVLQDVITAGLSAREKARIGVRWPVAQMTLEVSPEIKEIVSVYKNLLLSQLNMKDVLFDKVPVKYTIKPDYRVIGKAFGTQTGDVIPVVKKNEEQIISLLEEGKEEFVIDTFNLNKDMFVLTVQPAQGTTSVLFNHGKLLVDTQLTSELEAEGFTRELVRRVQSLRKGAGLQKKDRVKLFLSSPDKELLQRVLVHKNLLLERVGATELLTRADDFEVIKIKDAEFHLAI